jgi:hypothetical protein
VSRTRKAIVAATLVAATATAGLALSGSASAAPAGSVQPMGWYIQNYYADQATCQNVGQAGLGYGEWDAFFCVALGGGSVPPGRPWALEVHAELGG